MNPQVTDFITKLTLPWQAQVCTRLREIVHGAIPAVEERIQYGKPHFLKGGKYAAVLGTAKGWVTFTIFNAEALEGPEGFFEPGAPDRKTVKIREGQPIDFDLIAALLKQAVTSV